MGKKYIIELEDKPVCVFDEDTQTFFPRLHRVKGFNSLVFDQNGLDKLAPYTEPDLDAIRKEAYLQGYEQGYKDGYNEPGRGIQVGDEVKCIRAGWTAIVTKIKEDVYLTLMDKGGEIANCYDKKDFIKTGRHFPEIAEVLRKIQEES